MQFSRCARDDFPLETRQPASRAGRAAQMRRSLKTEQRERRPHECERQSSRGRRSSRRAPVRSPRGTRTGKVTLANESSTSGGGRPRWIEIHRIPRKEVIQPQLPLRLPCYDFTPVTDSTFDRSLHEGWATGFGCFRLPWCDGRCVQGPGTYSPRRC